jgi:hypothetical protein
LLACSRAISRSLVERTITLCRDDLSPDGALSLLGKHCHVNPTLQPQQFVEIGEALAKKKGINNGDPIKVRSNRGQIIAVAVVTKRIRPLHVDGKVIHTLGYRSIGALPARRRRDLAPTC